MSETPSEGPTALPGRPEGPTALPGRPEGPTALPGRPENQLTSLLASPPPPAAPTPAEEGASGDEDVDSLIDSLEALLAESRRMPFHKLLVDEVRLIAIVDRLRTAIPEEVRQAHQVLDQRDQILGSAQAKARSLMEERGLMEAIENERRRIMDDTDREVLRVRGEADRYARNVLLDLEERISKIQTSVRNGIETLEG